MSTKTRTVVVAVALLVVVAGVGLTGFAVVRARAAGSGAQQSLAAVTLPTVGASGAAAAPAYQVWTVGKAVGPVTVYRRPSVDAPVLTRLGKYNQNGYRTLVLVDRSREINGVTWTRVWVAMRPNETRGWVREGQLAYYTTSAKIVIDLSQRKLRVYRRGALAGTFPVAVGQPSLPTPTGFYFVNQKLRPPSPGGPYGVLALGISAFQPKLINWPQQGPVAIHGTNENSLIGTAASHGCVRMYNKDVLRVSQLVPAGSPVVIQQ